MSDDVFDDFFADEEDAPKAEAIEIEVAGVNPDLERQVKYLRLQLQTVDTELEEAQAAYYRFSSNISRKRESMDEVYCAPEGGVEGLHKVGDYMLTYAKCIGTEKPVPRSFEIVRSISLDEYDFNGSDDMDGVATYPFGLWVEMDRGSWAGSHYLWLKSGEVLTMDDVFEGDVEDRFSVYITTLPDGGFVIYSTDRPKDERLRNVIHRFDSKGNRVARYDLFDLDESEYFTDSGSWNSTFSHSLGVWPGPNGELVVEWKPGQYTYEDKVRAVFARNGEIIHQDKARFNGDSDGRSWEDYDEEKWSWENIRAELSKPGRDPIEFERMSSSSSDAKDGITLVRGDKRYYIDLSHLDLDSMLPEDREIWKAGGFGYGLDQKTHELMMVPQRCRYCDDKNDIKVYILKPVY